MSRKGGLNEPELPFQWTVHGIDGLRSNWVKPGDYLKNLGHVLPVPLIAFHNSALIPQQEQWDTCKQAVSFLLCSFISCHFTGQSEEGEKPCCVWMLRMDLGSFGEDPWGLRGRGCVRLAVTLPQFFSVWPQVHEEQRRYFHVPEMMWRDTLWVSDGGFLKSPKCLCGYDHSFFPPNLE